MKDRFCILKVIDPSPLDLSSIRSFLSEEYYVEIDNTFIIKCHNRFNDELFFWLEEWGINFLQIFINIRSGSDFYAIGLTDSDIDRLEKIIIDD